jgi:hypothetical protein
MSTKKAKTKIKARQLVALSKMGTQVRIPLTFQEAAALQERIEVMEDSAVRGVLARLLSEFIKNPTSQRYVAAS